MIPAHEAERIVMEKSRLILVMPSPDLPRMIIRKSVMPMLAANDTMKNSRDEKCSLNLSVLSSKNPGIKNTTAIAR